MQIIENVLHINDSFSIHVDLNQRKSNHISLSSVYTVQIKFILNLHSVPVVPVCQGWGEGGVKLYSVNTFYKMINMINVITELQLSLNSI